MNTLIIIGLLGLIAAILLFAGFKLRQFDKNIEDVFRDAFNQKDDENNDKKSFKGHY